MSASITESQQGPRPPAPWCPTLRLVYAGGSGHVAGPARALLRGSLVIGRDVPEEAGICLQEDRRASRRHVKVVVGAPAAGRRPVQVIDEGSKNGTFVNGQRVSTAPLQDGDVLRIGDSFLILRHEPPKQEDAPIAALVGVSTGARALRAALFKAAPHPVTVLLLGESGSGKEVAARALHEHSGRPGPFVAVNCGAIAEGLAESLLFGHAAGAFTGARAAQDGLVRASHGGTLFLDAIGELPATLQPKLLRVLEDRVVVPVGGVAGVACDLRMIAATNRDLEAEVQARRFRGDLYARLAEVKVSLPPLRDRREDILPLLMLALARPEARLAPDLVEALLLHPWPYNVREVFKLAAHLRVYAAEAAELDLDAAGDRLHSPMVAD